jgi:hypothetical protein
MAYFYCDSRLPDQLLYSLSLGMKKALTKQTRVPDRETYDGGLLPFLDQENTPLAPLKHRRILHILIVILRNNTPCIDKVKCLDEGREESR